MLTSIDSDVKNEVREVLVADGVSSDRIDSATERISTELGEGHLYDAQTDVAVLNAGHFGNLETAAGQRAAAGDIIHERIGHSALRDTGSMDSTGGHSARGVMTREIRQKASAKQIRFTPTQAGKVKQWLQGQAERFSR